MAPLIWWKWVNLQQISWYSPDRNYSGEFIRKKQQHTNHVKHVKIKSFYMGIGVFWQPFNPFYLGKQELDHTIWKRHKKCKSKQHYQISKFCVIGPIFTLLYLENGKSHLKSVSILHKENCIKNIKKKIIKSGCKIKASYLKSRKHVWE